MTTEESDDDEKIGYKRPPRHTRFRPGQSGNPRGRQKGVRNLGSDVKRTLEVPVRLSEQGKARQVSTQEAILLRLHRQFRMVIASPWYATLFPSLALAKETGLELVTTRGGSRYATSVGGTLTGRGADLIIIDDPLNANEACSEAARKRVIDWYGGALVSRLNDKQTGAIVAVMQRLHEDDLAGHLLRQGGWNHFNMPAIAFEDETIELGHGRTHLRRSGDILHPRTREPGGA